MRAIRFVIFAISFMLLVPFWALAAEPDANQQSLEGDYFFLRDSMTEWTAAPVNQFLELQNSRLINSIFLSTLTSYYSVLAPQTLKTSKSVELGISSGQSEGLVSSGPQRISARLEYIAATPRLDNAVSYANGGNGVTSLSQSRGADFAGSATLRHYGFKLDHELYFFGPSSSLYGLGMWLGFGVDYDVFNVEQFRVQNNINITVSPAIFTNGTNFSDRKAKTYFLSTPSLLGLAYQRALTPRIVVDARLAYLVDSFGETKLQYSGTLFSAVPTSATGGGSFPVPGEYKAFVKATTSGKGYVWNTGITYKINDVVSLRFHLEDRLMEYSISAYKFHPEEATALALNATSLFSSTQGASATAMLTQAYNQFLYNTIIPDLGPLPSKQVDRRRSAGLEVQLHY